MYKYEDVKDFIFTDEGQRSFIKMRDHVMSMIENSGACDMNSAISCNGLTDHDSFELMALVDRMVEIDDIFEIDQQNKVAGQFRIFVKRGR